MRTRYSYLSTPEASVTAENSPMLAFGTPIYVGKAKGAPDGMNDRLRAEIFERAHTQPTELRSNVNGWQSARDLMQWPGPDIEYLKKLFIDVSGVLSACALREPTRNIDAQFELTAWANLLRNGAYTAPHEHQGASWSCVYYVSIGEPDESAALSGKISFLDPRSNARIHGLDDALYRPITLTPKPGMLLAFPGWLTHMVHPFVGEGERISIACNVQVVSIQVNTNR